MFKVPYGQEVGQESTARPSAKKGNVSRPAFAGRASRSGAVTRPVSPLGDHSWTLGAAGDAPVQDTLGQAPPW